MLHRSIGIEPPRLHCGRAANYGSIIVPNTCRRLRREQPGFYRVSCIARPSGVVAHSRKRLRGSAHSVGNVPDAWIFSFQGSLSRKALRKQICLASCGENPLTRRWVMLSDFWTFLFSLSPFNGHFSARCQVSHRIYFYCGSERNNGGASRISRVLGKALPNKIPMGQNERTANYGTSVESCSVTSAYCLFQFLSSAVRSAEWENGGFAKLFPSANTTVTNPPRARFCGNFFIFPFATTTVKGPAFSKSGNKKSSKSFQTYCFCCRCDGRLLFSFGTM